MPAATSRYAGLATRSFTLPDGREVHYLARRFVPAGGPMPTLATVTVTQGDRLDLIAARTLGDPEQFWRLCDANDALDPFELTATLGRVLKVAVPQF